MADDNFEQVLIVYSAASTPPSDIAAAEAAVAAFAPERRRGATRVEPRVFRVPDAAAPGQTLGTELSQAMDQSIGAIVFVDDLRPNVSYELGYMHGRGRSVLLLTRRAIDEVWLGISDLAGAAVVGLDQVDLTAAISQYLARVYASDLPRASAIPLMTMPSLDSNLLNKLDLDEHAVIEGPYGRGLRIERYEPPSDLRIATNLLPQARLTYVIRGEDENADYTVYARVRYKNREGRRRRVWLGATSLRRDSYIARDERLIPARSPTPTPRLLILDLAEVVSAGFLLGAESPDYLECLRFRAGARRRQNISWVEVPYVGLVGEDG